MAAEWTSIGTIFKPAREEPKDPFQKLGHVEGLSP